MYELPKGYLSWSSINLWNTNKDMFRRVYYFKDKKFETRETIFGKKIALMLENKEYDEHPTLRKIPRYEYAEYKIEIEVEGIKVYGVLDSFSLRRKAFKEYKTGHKSKDGKDPWDELKVRKHGQLPFYSFLIEQKFGKVEEWTELIHLETAFGKETTEFDGHILEGTNDKLVLTGKVKKFKRKIEQYERDRIRQIIKKAAKEISEDFLLFKDGKYGSIGEK